MFLRTIKNMKYYGEERGQQSCTKCMQNLIFSLFCMLKCVIIYIATKKCDRNKYERGFDYGNNGKWHKV